MFHRRFIISTIITILAALPCIADTGYSARINELIAQKQAKMKQLEKCQGTTKNLKIAGLSTLGITVVGVGANIAEAVILNQYDDKISDAEKARDEAKTKYTEQNEKDCLKLNGDGKPSYDSENNICTVTETNNVNEEDFDRAKTVLNDDDYNCKEEINNANRFKAVCTDLTNDTKFTLKFDIDYTLSDTQGEQPEEQPEANQNTEKAQQASDEPSEFEKLCKKYYDGPEQFPNYVKCKLKFSQTPDLKFAKNTVEDMSKGLKCDSGKDIVCAGNVCNMECKKSSKSDEYDIVEAEFKAIKCPIAGQVVQPNGCECKEGSTLSPNGKSCIDNITNEPIKAAAKKQETKPQNNNNDNELVKKCDGVANKNFCKRCKGNGVKLDVDNKYVSCYKIVNKTVTGPEAEKEFLEFKEQVYPESKDTDFYNSLGKEIYKHYDKQPKDSKKFTINIQYNAITCPIKGQIPDGWSGVGGICICPEGQILNKEQNECIPEKTATKTAGNNNMEKAEESTSKNNDDAEKNDNNDDITKQCDGVTNKDFCKRCKGEGVELVVLDGYIRCDKTVNKTITGPEAEKEFLELKKQVYPESKNTRFHISSDRRTIDNYYDKLPNDSKELVIYITYDAITCPIKGQVAEGWSGKGGICICPDGSKLENNMCVVNVTDYKWYKYTDVAKGIAAAKKYLKKNDIDTKDITCTSEGEVGYFGDDYILCYPKNEAVYRFQFHSLNAPRDEEKDGFF